MISRLLLVFSLLLAPATVLAESLSGAGSCEQTGAMTICALSGPTLMQGTSSDTEAAFDFTITSLVGTDGLGVIIRDGRLTIENGFLTASIGCNALSAPIVIGPDNVVSIIGEPASTAMYCVDLNEQEALLSAILLGRRLLLDPVVGTLSSENGSIALVERMAPLPTPLPETAAPTTPPIDAGMGGMVEGDGVHADYHSDHHFGFLGSFATAAIALLLFGLGFYLGLQSDRRGGLRGKPGGAVPPLAMPNLPSPAKTIVPPPTKTVVPPASRRGSTPRSNTTERKKTAKKRVRTVNDDEKKEIDYGV